MVDDSLQDDGSEGEQVFAVEALQRRTPDPGNSLPPPEDGDQGGLQLQPLLQKLQRNNHREKHRKITEKSQRIT